MIDLGVQIDAGMLIGTTLSGASLGLLNGRLGGQTYFDDTSNRLFSGRKSFISNYVDIFRNSLTSIKNMVSSVTTVNGFITIDSKEKLGNVPLDMHMSILQYAPIRKLFDSGRIFGFGYEDIPPDDPYGRIAVTNGYCPDVDAARDKDGNIELNWEWREGDPLLDWDEMDAIVETREYLDYIINHTDIDPTDYPNEVL